jgi:hypothetical protein
MNTNPEQNFIPLFIEFKFSNLRTFGEGQFVDFEVGSSLSVMSLNVEPEVPLRPAAVVALVATECPPVVVSLL